MTARIRTETLLTAEDVARRLRLPQRRVRALAVSGELPGFRVGASWRFRPSSIDKWERQRERDAS